jgi:hypothetical protein
MPFRRLKLETCPELARLGAIALDGDRPRALAIIAIVWAAVRRVDVSGHYVDAADTSGRRALA